MNRSFKILVIIIICIIIIIGVSIKVMFQHNEKNNSKRNEASETLQDNFTIVDDNGYILKGSIKNSIDTSTEKRLEKRKVVKGFISYISDEGFFEIHNSYYIDSLGMNIDEYDNFFVKISFSPNNISIVNYYTSEKMNLEEISPNDLVLFNAKIIYSTIEEPIITIEDNKIFVLKEKDLNKMVLDKYQGEKVFENVKIVGKNDYNFEGKDYTYIYAQIKFNTTKNDELVYCFTLQLTDNTIIENTQDYKYADIVLEDSFEKTIESVHYNACRRANKITYK